MKKAIALLVIISVLASGIALAQGDELVNIALNKPVTASGYTYGMAPQSVVDDNFLTGWSSETADGTWLVIDLGKKVKIEKVEVITRQDLDQAHTRNNFVIEVSDSPNFIDAVICGQVGNDPIPYRDKFQAVLDGSEKYRYVRYRKVAGNYSYLGEIRVLVKPVNVPAEGVNFLDSIADNGLRHAMGLLSYLDIMSATGAEGEFEAPVTRGEFAIYLYKALNLSPTDSDYFGDIKNSNVKTAVNALCDLGVISKNSKGVFEEDKPIVLYEATKMVVSALGYDKKAESTSGYPVGYINVANEINLLSKMSKSGFAKKDAAHIIYNMLDTRPFMIKSIITGDDMVTYEKDVEKLINKVFGIYSAKGVIMANYYASATTEVKELKQNEVIIDDSVFFIADEAFNEYFGNMVTYYYKETQYDINEVVFMQPFYNQYITQFNFSKLHRFDKSTISYYNTAQNTENIRYDLSTIILYNGRIFKDFKLNELEFKEGFIKCIDFENDGVAEIVSITDTKTYIVDKIININNPTIYFQHQQPALEMRETDTITVFYPNGDISGVASLKRDDVVSIAKNGNNYQIYVGENPVEGKLSEITDEKVVINFEDMYDISPFDVDKENWIIGGYGTFYLSYFKTAVLFTADVYSGTRYGYWTKYAASSGVDSTIELKILTDMGNFAVYTVSNNIEIDGIKYNSKTDINRAIQTLYNINGGLDGQVIRYSANMNLQINMLDTISKSAENDKFSLDYKKDIDNAYIRQNIIGGEYIVDENAVVFQVPLDKSQESKYKASSRQYFESNGGPMSIKVYGDTNEIGLPRMRAAVVTAGTAKIDYENPFVFIISKVTKAVDSEGNEMINLYGYNRKKIQQFVIDDTDLIASVGGHLSCGDVLIIGFNDERKILKLNYVYDVQQSSVSLINPTRPLWSDTGVINYDSWTMCGVAEVEVSENSFIKTKAAVGVPAHLTKSFIFNADKATGIYVYDKQADILSFGSINDIISLEQSNTGASTIFFSASKILPQEFVIYRE